MKPIPETSLSREAVVLHRALDRDAHDESPAVGRTAVPSAETRVNKVRAVPEVPAAKQTGRVAEVRPAETQARATATPAAPTAARAGPRIVDPKPAATASAAVPSAVATPPAERTARLAEVAPRPAGTRSAVAESRPAPTRATAAVPTAAPAPPPGRSVPVADGTAARPEYRPFFDLSKVAALDGPVTFRSFKW